MSAPDADGAGVEVLDGGFEATVQDLDGRVGLLAEGFAPAGAMDPLAARAANLLVGNDAAAPVLEVLLARVRLRARVDTRVSVCGGPARLRARGRTWPLWQSVSVAAGDELVVESNGSLGCRQYIAFEGGLDVAPVLGSPATFRPGSIGGLGGRALRRGDLLRLARPGAGGGTEQRLRADVRPETPRDWTVEALPGPQGAPEYLTAEGLRRLFELHWRVSPHSNRVGIRLAPERLGWSRPSGGLAGRHPSNILDQPYPLGGVNLAGDTPVILGPDAPTAGGFVIAATVVSGAIWKLGQVRPGLDTLRLRSVGLDEADAIARELDELLTPESLEPVR